MSTFGNMAPLSDGSYIIPGFSFPAGSTVNIGGYSFKAEELGMLLSHLLTSHPEISL